MSGSDRMRDSLEHLHAAQDQLNACTLITEDASRARPRRPSGQHDRGSQGHHRPEGPADHLRFGVLPQVPSASAPVIERLKDEGAVIVARTGLHEFAYGFSSENHWFGPVRNPWDPATSPGGSSGGSAVAVAAGLVDGALGTDTGGSIRVPAAMTGHLRAEGDPRSHPDEGRLSVGAFARHGRSLRPRHDHTLPFCMAPWPRTEAAPVAARHRGTAGRGAPDLGGRWSVGASGASGLRRHPGRAAVARSRGCRNWICADLVPWGKIQELAGAEAAHVHRAFRAAGQPYGPRSMPG